MKKRFAMMALTMGMLAVILCCSGCRHQTPPQKNEIKFASYTQQERKDYINDFFWKNYGVRGEITQVMQKQDGPFLLEDHYFAVVRLPNNKLICVWVSKKGEITDTMFMLDMQDDIYEHFESVVKAIIPEFRMRVRANMVKIPSAKLTKGDDVGKYLSEQPVSSDLYIFVDEEAQVDEHTLDRLEEVLNYSKVNVHIFVCEDLENVDMGSYTSLMATYSRQIRKKE